MFIINHMKISSPENEKNPCQNNELFGRSFENLKRPFHFA